MSSFFLSNRRFLVAYSRNSWGGLGRPFFFPQGSRQERTGQLRVAGATPRRALAGLVGWAAGGEPQAQAHQVVVAAVLLDQARQPCPATAHG
jgi:hypothetical protein